MSSNSASFKDIKIPYPTEGIIRTAQLDDTVTPENSVQIAVNMNFDRIGAVQTRLGVSTYATTITGPIKNFGRLSNIIIPDGYTRLAPFPSTTIFEPVEADDVAIYPIDDTTFLVLWSDSAGDGFGSVYTVDPITGEFTLTGGPTEWNLTDATSLTITRIDLTHFLIVYEGDGSDGFAQVMTVSGGSITMEGAPLEFDAVDLRSNSVAMIDANHFIVFYEGPDGDGFAKVLEVNLGTWAVTVVGAGLEFETADAEGISCVAVGDGTHFIAFWDGLSDNGWVQCFTVNTGTWAITANGSPLSFTTDMDGYNSSQALGDGQHFINFWRDDTLPSGKVQVFELNLTTFAVTALSTALNFGGVGSGINNQSVAVGDGQHFINTWRQVNFPAEDTANVQVFEVNLTTFAVTAISNALQYGEVGSVSAGETSVVVTIGTDYRPVVSWIDPDGIGNMKMLIMSGTPNSFTWLYAQEGDGDVLNWDNPGWVVRRSGLNIIHKARFAQFLNYIWMVNGNEFEGGDPVATSDGGNFGTDLVPAGFPPGDFIQAGFEGRVWVADSLFDIVYFTDIVQFTPPNTYTLTYDPAVNFIKNFSPQDGESITGLIQVPRALLLFKENHIFRIYGAFSVDAYPAYNVGTYSQESIVQTKDGVYFHHSSGFYKFTYDSQPTEISRRVIDFIRAIPRAFYPEVKGLYDGFDNIEWAVGPITVEGVTYTNCVMRFTISTQLWTIYDYPLNTITALFLYNDGAALNSLMGTQAGLVGKMDSGTTDFGASIYYELIDRWRSFTEMRAKSKILSGMNVFTENAGGARLEYQTEKSGVNVWEYIDTVSEEYCSLFPNFKTNYFNIIRLRISGNTIGAPIVFNGIEILSVQDEGFNKN